jgi:hypothetical protein
MRYAISDEQSHKSAPTGTTGSKPSGNSRPLEGQGSTSPFEGVPCAAPASADSPTLPLTFQLPPGQSPVEQVVGHRRDGRLALVGQDVWTEASTLALNSPAG